MTYRGLVKGAQIFSRYAKGGLNAHIGGAGHDIIWAEAAEPIVISERDADGAGVCIDSRMSAEDNRKLKELGWFIDPDTGVWTAYC